MPACADCTCEQAGSPPATGLRAAVDNMLAEADAIVGLSGAQMTRYPMMYGSVWASLFAARALLAHAADQLAQASERGVKV